MGRNSGLEVTDVKFNSYEDGNLLGFASITFNDDLVTTGWRLLDGNKGMWAAPPSRKDKEGEYKDILFAMSEDLREDINEAVIEAYENADKKPKRSSSSRGGKESSGGSRRSPSKRKSLRYYND